MSKVKKRVLVIVVAILVIGLAIGTKYLVDVEAYKSQVAALQIEDFNLAEVPDGTYTGAYDARFIKVKVQVDVKDHRISHIALIQHENGKGSPAEAIIPKVIEAQSLEVDTISGATNSSRVILKSIEIALSKTS